MTRYIIPLLILFLCSCNQNVKNDSESNDKLNQLIKYLNTRIGFIVATAPSSTQMLDQAHNGIKSKYNSQNHNISFEEKIEYAHDLTELLIDHYQNMICYDSLSVGLELLEPVYNLSKSDPKPAIVMLNSKHRFYTRITYQTYLLTEGGKELVRTDTIFETEPPFYYIPYLEQEGNFKVQIQVEEMQVNGNILTFSNEFAYKVQGSGEASSRMQ